MRVAGVVCILAVLVILFASWRRNHQEEHLHCALAASAPPLGISEQQLDKLADILAERGEGSTDETREVLFWLISSAKLTQDRIEPAAKAALGLVHIKNSAPRDAVAEVLKLRSSDIKPAPACR